MDRLGSLLRHTHAPARRSIAHLSDFQPICAKPISVASESFADGGAIPLRFSGRRRGENISPQLSWSGLPENTKQLLLVIEDPDVPLPFPFVHTVVLFAPTGSSGTIHEGELSAGGNRFAFIPWLGMRGYHGPTPLRGQGDHHYGFHLFALNRVVSTKTYRQLRRQIKGHILTKGCITGTQQSP